MLQHLQSLDAYPQKLVWSVRIIWGQLRPLQLSPTLLLGPESDQLLWQTLALHSSVWLNVASTNENISFCAVMFFHCCNYIVGFGYSGQGR